MADEKGKKFSKSPKPSKPSIHPAEPVIVGFFIATILGAILLRFSGFLGSRQGFGQFLHTLWLFLEGEVSFAGLMGATGSPLVAPVLFYLKIFSFVFSVFMLGAILFLLWKYSALNKKLREPLKPPKEIFYGVSHAPERYVNPKWAKVLEHINSPNSSDWKLAILEADIMLSDALDKMGYRGATMSDKLKSIEPSDFDTLQEAWEAHKIRNAIAHEGSDYTINKPEAERVVKLFQKVFEEFKYI